ncbi:hypothetical protein ABMA27_016994 [Loxostege sticticalis]|uniref:CheW-like domain-containing protein n=1 Tax=Loxostege sticticalis TaxID=481309 RepID=A0ABR3GYH9_LOXSC
MTVAPASTSAVLYRRPRQLLPTPSDRAIATEGVMVDPVHLVVLTVGTGRRLTRLPISTLRSQVRSGTVAAHVHGFAAKPLAVAVVQTPGALDQRRLI